VPRGAVDEVDEVDERVELAVMVDETDDDDVDETDDDDDPVGAGPTLYISSLFPAPQYSKALPGQVKLQSAVIAKTDPTPRALPQKHSPPYSTPK